MKVKELIKELEKLNPELIVVVDGYEGGVAELKICGETTVELNRYSEWYYGEHEECKPDDENAVTVCYLPR